MTVTISGTSGISTPTMTEVNGDPIVESGSNSDGAWTRWADGTQTMRATIDKTSDGFGLISIDFPIAMIDGSYSISAGTITKTGNDSTTVDAEYDPNAASYTENQFKLRLREGFGSLLASTTVTLVWFALGRWK